MIPMGRPPNVQLQHFLKLLPILGVRVRVRVEAHGYRVHKGYVGRVGFGLIAYSPMFSIILCFGLKVR